MSRAGSFGMAFGSFAVVGKNGVRLTCAMIRRPELEHVGVRGLNYESKYRTIYEEFSPINHLDAHDPPLYMEYNRPMNLPAKSDGEAIHHPMFGLRMWEKSNSTAAGHECHLRFINSNKVAECRTTTAAAYASGEEFLPDILLASGTTFTVICNGNGNDSGSSPTNHVKTHGAAPNLVTNSGNLALPGHTVAGWNSAAASPDAAWSANWIDPETSSVNQWTRCFRSFELAEVPPQAGAYFDVVDLTPALNRSTCAATRPAWNTATSSSDRSASERQSR